MHAVNPQKLDIHFLVPFVEGTTHVLKIQCQTVATPGKPFFKGRQEFNCPVDIAGILGITSQAFNGTIAICFPEKVFLSLMSKMLGEEFTEINKDLEDGAAELLNMIFGHAKKILNPQGHTIEKALPTVIRAKNLSINHNGSKESILLPFSIDDMTFYMEIATEKTAL